MPDDLSLVSLHDSETCWRDEKARSIGYFAKSGVVRVDSDMVTQIKKMAFETGENVRLSMHTTPDAEFHDMIVFQHRDRYYRPKKHLNKPMSFHMMEGEMAIFVFDDEGNIIDVSVLDGQENIVYRVAAGLYHTDLPLTEYVVHHECTMGPFVGDSDREFAPWSPDGSDTGDYLRYRDELAAMIG